MSKIKIMGGILLVFGISIIFYPLPVVLASSGEAGVYLLRNHKWVLWDFSIGSGIFTLGLILYRSQFSRSDR